MAEPTTPAGTLTNGAKLIGEVILPGVSQMVDGDIKMGSAHAAAALIAGATLGPMLAPLVWAAASLNSFSRSTTGQNFHEHFRPGKG